MKKLTFPLVITEGGVTARIRQTAKQLNGKSHTYYIVEYVLLGQRKQEWRANSKQAKQAAYDACRRIGKGEQMVLQLKNGDRLASLVPGQLRRSAWSPQRPGARPMSRTCMMPAPIRPD